MSAFTARFFEARKTYGALISGLQYELIDNGDGYGIEVDDSGTCYPVEFDKYDNSVIYLVNANTVKLDEVTE